MTDKKRTIPSSEDRELLLGWMESSLSDALEHNVTRRLETDTGFALAAERLRRLDTLLSASAPDGFQPFFASRVTDRLFAQHPPVLTVSDALLLLFPRMALACFVVTLVIGAFNVLSYGQPILDGSVLDALLSLPRPSMENALFLATD